MPLAGGRAGTRQRSAILSYQDRQTIAAGASFTTPFLNTIGFSRISVAITQRTGSHTGTAQLYGVVASFTDSGGTYGALRLMRTIVIGSISAPEVCDVHWGFRMLQLVITAPTFTDGPPYNFDFNVYGSASS